MATPDADDLDGLAGEYVLGTLDAVERWAVEARLRSDPPLRRAIAEWERRLQPLADAPAENPHAGSLAAIMARIGPEAPGLRSPGDGAGRSPPAADNVVALRQRVRRWQWASGGLAAAAAALAGIIVVDRWILPRQTEFVAVLTSAAVDPAFVATVDVASNRISVRRVGGEPAPEDRSYELWAIRGEATPVSLGLLDDDRTSGPIPVRADAETLLAVTLEPRGGKPPDQPAGPLVFSGQLVPTE